MPVTAYSPNGHAPRSSANAPVVLVHDFSGGYGVSPVVQGVSLEIPRGQFVGLVGPSGAGKTSLLKALLGGLPHTTGQVMVDGRWVTPGTPPRGVGYVPQIQTVDWTFPVSVEDVVLMGRTRRMGPLPWPSRADRAAVDATLQRLGLGGLRRRHIRELSGGQQQRVFLARALIGEPELLILDEPTASVDVKTRDDILHLLAELNRQGITIILTTHELNAVAAHLPYVVCVNGGIVAQGSPLDIFTEKILSRTFAADMRVIRDEETGGMLIAEAGRHGPFAEPLFHHAHLHEADIPHERAALGPSTSLPDHPHDGFLHPREDPFAELAGATNGRGHAA
jgi:zinc/manganese transport system ATP-binding protein/zinc transport system ATP-binding protein